MLADALATYVMGFEVEQVPYLMYGYREGVGNNRWQNIIGVDPAQVKFPYRQTKVVGRTVSAAAKNAQGLFQGQQGSRYPAFGLPGGQV